jgi:hypothetical protein
MIWVIQPPMMATPFILLLRDTATKSRDLRYCSADEMLGGQSEVRSKPKDPPNRPTWEIDRNFSLPGVMEKEKFQFHDNGRGIYILLGLAREEILLKGRLSLGE